MKQSEQSTNIHDYIVKTLRQPWQPLIEKGVHYEGISVMSLRFDAEQQRSKTILLQFEPGASYPYHNHPAGEELFVLEGETVIENVTLSKGDYLYTPPGFKHAVTTKTGCTLLLAIPEEVELLNKPI